MADLPPRPKALPVIFESIPDELKKLDKWVVWKYVWKEDKKKWDKPPLTPQGKSASTTDPKTWSSFAEVKTAYERGKFDGVGFVLNGDIVGLDFDKCRDLSTGEISSEVLKIIDDFNSYTEISPSGTGIRLFVKGGTAKIGRKNPKKGFEIYNTGRYLTVTGNQIDYSDKIETRSDAIDAFIQKNFSIYETRHNSETKTLDNELIALAANNSEKFSKLYAGNWESLYQSQSEADLAFCSILASYTTSGGQIDRIFRASKLYREKWDREDYRERTIQKAFETMGATEIIKMIQSDPRNIKNHDVIKTLAALKANDPIEYDLVMESIKKAGTGIKVDTINRIIERYIEDHSEEQPTEPDEGIHEKALAIATHGDPFKFLIFQAQRNHLGDIGYQKVLIASIASASSLRSKGIQPGGNGEKGSGKSDACASVYHLMPQDRTLEGSLSPMSLFYLQETGRLKSGMVLFSDDVEYEPIIPIYKRSTARFQKGITHNTVSGGKDRHGIELTIPPRIVWWLTSVESVANEQAFDRQYPISTDSTPGHKERVAREIAARRARKELTLSDDEGIEVARDIIRDVFDNGPFMVLIPQADKAVWTKKHDFRGQEQFWDLVDALVILRWRQHKRDEDGWLMAEDKDLIEAREILTGHKVAHFADLTEAEVKLVGTMCALGKPITQKELTEAVGVAQSTLSERLRSIMAKSAIVTEDYEAGKKVYAINPKMSVGEEYWKGVDLIDLKIADNEAYRSHQIALSGCYRYVIGIPIGIIINNSNRIPSSLSVDKELCIEKGCPCDLWLKEYPFLYTPTDKTDNDRKQHQEDLSDTDKSDRYEPIRTDNDSNGPDDIPIRHTGEAVTVRTNRTDSESSSINAALDEKQRRSEEKETRDRELQIRTACIAEYGSNGWVDPRKIASRLKYELKYVISWLEANYIRHKELVTGIFGYTQKSTVKV